MIRPTTLPAHLDGLRLRAKLAEFTSDGWDSPTARTQAIEILKDYLAEGRELAASRIEGSKGGLAAARTLSDVMNAMMRALYDSIAIDFTKQGAREPGLTLCALGGYGAGELAPNSDIDLVFLSEKKIPKWAPIVIERASYALWDCGLTVGGGSVRTVDEALKLAKSDVSERTALLDIRFITGDITLLRRLMDKFENEIVKPNAVKFAEAKLAERDARVEKQGDSRYAVEPNVKDGKGGLRDLQTLRWLAQVLYGDDALERWVADGFFTVRDVERFIDAADFLWTTRFHMHTLIGRKTDQLTFDIQPDIAARMGFSDGEAHLAVEAFMRAYFLKAIDVGKLTRLVCAKLESDHFKVAPVSSGRFMPSDGEKVDANLNALGFQVRAGRLDFSPQGQPQDNPHQMMRLFELAAAHNLDLHPDAVANIGHSLHFIDDRYRQDPQVARSFFAILLDADNPRVTLRSMTEAGLLGTYIPEFGDIVARTQFNMYHRFTVDEHILNALGWLRDIESKRFVEDHPLITELCQTVRHRRALHLAALLHDTGKGKGDQTIEGEKIAIEVCERLGLDDAEVELVAWLVRHHVDMSDTAQRRDVTDPVTVYDFAELVGNEERLVLLSILTIVDIRAVGPGVWNGWKGQLLRDLFVATRAVLGEKGDIVSAESSRERLNARADRARDTFVDAVEAELKDRALDWTQALSDNYWLAFTQADRLRHGQFGLNAQSRGVDLAVSISFDAHVAATEVMIYAPDRPGLFADIAGAIASEGANVLGAQVNTTHSGYAFDVFFVQSSDGTRLGEADRYEIDRLKTAVEQAAISGLGDITPDSLRPLQRREAAFKINPSVTLVDDGSDDALVIEASGRDRWGLIYALAKTLTSHGLNVVGARIDGYGERAVDSFFVTENGQKPNNPDRLEAVKSDLVSVLAAGEERAEAKREADNLMGAQSSEQR
jgi:[protein-PII] uridylyltransferase